MFKSCLLGALDPVDCVVVLSKLLGPRPGNLGYSDKASVCC